MINQVYRLVSPRQIEITYKDRAINEDKVAIRPTHMSICAADQRYYTGSRDKKILSKKLPMSLIHEAVGEVVYDPTGVTKKGSYVVMLPNTPVEKDEIIGENYLRSSKFRSSGYDGFMQDYVFMNHDRIIELPKDVNLHVASFLELLSVAMQSIARFEKKSHERKDVIGVWGDGNLGFITSLILKNRYKDSKVVVFGKNEEKLSLFSFANETYIINEIPEELTINHGFECVGGKGSQYAISQMIDIIQPEGSMSILGVSEDPIEMNTRMILEKGLLVIGSSRSSRDDFVNAVEFISNKEMQDYLQTLVTSINEVRCIKDINDAFEKDLNTSWGKTVIEWKI